MSLDPSIPLGIRPVKINTPAENAIIRAERDRLEQSVRANEVKLRQDEQEMRDRLAVQRILREGGGDLSTDTIGRIRAISPKLAMDFEDHLVKLRRQAAETAQTELDNERKLTDFGLGLLAAIPEGDEETYQAIRPLLVNRIPDIAPILPERYDYARLQQAQEFGRQAKDRLGAMEEAWQAAMSGDFRYYPGLLATEPDPAERQNIRRSFLLAGAPRSLLDAMERNPQAASMTENERQQALSRQADDERAERSAASLETYRGAQLAQGQERINLQRQGLTLRREQQKAGSAQASSSLPPEYATALDRAILAIPAVRRPAIVNLADRLWKGGDEAQLKEVIRQAAIETENVDTKNQIRGRHDAAAAVRDIRQSLQELKQSGVDTNLLRGGIEDVARKLGTSTDPRLAEVGTRVLDAYVSYRRSLTGVQFSERESAEYMKLFPNYRNTLPLNEAILRGLERAMATRDREFWTRKLGPGGAKLVGAMGDEGQPPPAGDRGSYYERYLQRKRGGGR